jgi:hypothetical protein
MVNCDPGFDPGAEPHARGATEPSEIAWRLTGWRVGRAWKAVRAMAASAQQPR